MLAWIGALAVFTLVWVVLGGCLSWLPVSGASSMLAALGLWLTLTFAVPAALALAAERAAPMPSRLLSIVRIRAAQQESEAHEQDLAKAGTRHTPACRHRRSRFGPRPSLHVR